MNPQDHGLLWSAEASDRAIVEKELSASFSELYGTVADMKESVRVLEADLNRVLYGVRPDGEPRGGLGCARRGASGNRPVQANGFFMFMAFSVDICYSQVYIRSDRSKFDLLHSPA
jgi:hypothetical protein